MLNHLSDTETKTKNGVFQRSQIMCLETEPRSNAIGGLGINLPKPFFFVGKKNTGQSHNLFSNSLL